MEPLYNIFLNDGLIRVCFFDILGYIKQAYANDTIQPNITSYI